MEMNPKLKEKWVTALRSGNYPQSKDVLKSPDGYCCLGVLAEISGMFNSKFDGFDAVDGCTTLLPPEVMPRSIQGRLAQMNDDESLSFAEIADYIEKEF